jgi:hypothetical protein
MQTVDFTSRERWSAHSQHRRSTTATDDGHTSTRSPWMHDTSSPSLVMAVECFYGQLRIEPEQHEKSLLCRVTAAPDMRSAVGSSGTLSAVSMEASPSSMFIPYFPLALPTHSPHSVHSHPSNSANSQHSSNSHHSTATHPPLYHPSTVITPIGPSKLSFIHSFASPLDFPASGVIPAYLIACLGPVLNIADRHVLCGTSCKEVESCYGLRHGSSSWSTSAGFTIYIAQRTLYACHSQLAVISAVIPVCSTNQSGIPLRCIPRLE